MSHPLSVSGDADERPDGGRAGGVRGEEGRPHRLLPPAHIPPPQETHTGELEGTVHSATCID